MRSSVGFRGQRLADDPRIASLLAEHEQETIVEAITFAAAARGAGTEAAERATMSLFDTGERIEALEKAAEEAAEEHDGEIVTLEEDLRRVTEECDELKQKLERIAQEVA